MDRASPEAGSKSVGEIDGSEGAGRPDKSRPDGQDREADSLLGYMRQRRQAITDLLSTFGQSPDPQRGAAVLLLVEELANLHAIRSEIYRPILKGLGEQGTDLLNRFDHLSEEVQRTLAELDSLSSGVGPMDILVPDPERVIGMVDRLADQVQAYDLFETGELNGVVLAQLPPVELDRLGRQARSLRDKEQVHPHPDRRPVDEQFDLLRRAQAIYDRVRNKTSHPRRALGGGGEAGP